jgi:hypothetical protein
MENTLTPLPSINEKDGLNKKQNPHGMFSDL